MSNFQTLLLDIDGVLFNADHEISGVRSALLQLKVHGFRLVFVTNNVSLDRPELTQRIQQLVPGLDVHVFDPLHVLEYILLKQMPQLRRKCLVIGSSILSNRVQGLGCTVVTHDSADDASLVLVSSSTILNYAMLAAAVHAIGNGAMLCGTGRERVFRWHDKLWPGSGAILAAIENACSCEAMILGKPGPDIFQMAAGETDASRVLVIGDDIDTDIRGAQSVGFSSVLVLTGLSSIENVEASAYRPNAIVDDLPQLAHQIINNVTFLSN
ncbi:MAG: HAD-IIA family hydrolase [Aggregatilineales bacterium]